MVMVELMEMVEMMAGPLDQLVWEHFRQSSFPCVRSASSASNPSRSFVRALCLLERCWPSPSPRGSRPHDAVALMRPVRHGSRQVLNDFGGRLIRLMYWPSFRRPQ